MVDNQNTKIQFKRKTSDADLANIALNEGEPLFIPGLDQLRIGKGSPSAENNTAANALILGSATLTAEETDEGDGAQLVFTNSDTSKSSTIPIVGSDNLSVTYDTTNKKIKLNGTAQVIVVEDCPEDTTDVDALGPGTTNSIGIVKRKIGSSADKYSYTAYVYNEGTWKAMDGNYSADNVYIDSEIRVKGDFDRVGGYIESESVIAAGTSLKTILNTMLTKTLPPDITEPTVSISVSGSDNTYEVGTTYTKPTATLVVTTGEYSYGPTPTGVTYAEGSVLIRYGSDIDDTRAPSQSNAGAITADGETSIDITPDTYSHDEQTATYTDNFASYSFVGKGTYSDGNFAKDNLGNTDEDSSPKITANTKTDSKTVNFRGYRKVFCGHQDSDSADLSSSAIRALNLKQDRASACRSFEVTVPNGAKRLIIAAPTNSCGKNYTKQKVEMYTSNWEDYTAKFVSVTGKSVQGANNYDAQNYNVYVYEFKLGVDTQFRVTLNVQDVS